MNSVSEKEVILKAWNVSDDVAIIKDVATKGSYVEMCVEYLARRRRVTVEESRKNFDHHVNVYVNRLLRDKLVYKAEGVLRNVGRNVQHVYFQYAFDSDDLAVKSSLMEHLKKGQDGASFEVERVALEGYCEMLKEATGRVGLHRSVVAEIGKLSLENLFLKDEGYRQQLAAEIFFDTKQQKLLPLLERKVVWNYLVSKSICKELSVWSRIFFNKKHELPVDIENVLTAKYHDWEIDEEMFMHATTIRTPTETLRNIFAANGHIFPDEKDNVQKVLSRLFTSESFEFNKELVEKLPLTKFLAEVEANSMLLEDFITCSSLENIKKDFPERTAEIDFIISLKSSELNDPTSFAQLSRTIARYLQQFDEKLYENNPTIRLVELLGENASVEDLEMPTNWPILKQLPYLEAVVQRIKSPQSACFVTMEDFLRKFNGINLRKITDKLGTEPIGFGNESLSATYAPKIRLNYFHFIRQNRSAYAVYCFMSEQLNNYSQISKSQLCMSAEFVSEMAIKNSIRDPELLVNCVAYVEMLGFDTRTIRSYLKLQQLASDTNTCSDELTTAKLIAVSEAKLFANSPSSATDFPIRLYSAIVAVTKSVQPKIWPELYLESIAATDNWWQILLFAQYFDIPVLQIWKFTKSFKTASIGEHLARALAHDPVPEKSKRRQSFSRLEHRRKSIRTNGDDHNSQTTSGDTITSSSSSEASQLQKSRNQLKFLQQLEDIDLFAIILLSASDKPEDVVSTYEKFVEVINDAEVHYTSLNLLKNAVHYDLPVLAVLSAVVNNRNVQWCWATWLLTSMGIWKKYNVCSDGEEFVLALIERSVRTRSVRTLHQSFQIFFPNSQFKHLTSFLLRTSEHNFDEESIRNLSMYLLACSNENLSLPLVDLKPKNFINFSIKLIVLHLTNSFTSSYYQHIFLDIVCQSGLNEVSSTIDFRLLKEVTEIIKFTKAKMDYEKLVSANVTGTASSIQTECQIICTYLEEWKEFDKAIKLATLLTMPIADLVYAKWIHSIEDCNGELEFSANEKETEMYMLPPELLINFYLYVSVKGFMSVKQKLQTLKKALDVIKKNHLLPNEFFDRDTIEFDMIVSYLGSDLTLDDLDIYHSKYFEQILLQERCVLYKSFPELKELAGVEVLKTKKIEMTETMRLKFEVLINKLLDDGDIVQALRLQAMFDHRPIDLHFIVFCMALAEGITNIYNLPNNERQLIIEVEKNALLFYRRILGRTKGSSQYGNIPSPTKPTDISESTSNLEFEEIPSREKQDVLKALQGIVSRLNHGVNIGKRIMMVYRAAMHLDKEYLDVLKTKDSLFLLRNAIEEDCMEKLVVMSDILLSSRMSQHEVADFLSSEIATAVIRPRFYILNPALPTAQNILWGFDLEKDFHLILELSSNTILLGNCLLDYCDALKTYRKYQDNKSYERDIEENSQIVNAFDNLRDIIRRYGLPNNHQGTAQVLSHKKQNTIYVELLIKAHDCFVHELSMEGIANVLNRAKTLNSILSSAKSWNLIVRMLTGIGRYREMYYCIGTLIGNDQFESLLGQFDEEKAKGLRHAIIQYIHEICPQNREYYRLTALHFSMFKELAEMWETEGNSVFAKIISNYHVLDDEPTPSRSGTDDGKLIRKSKLYCSSELLTDLGHAVEDFTHATENYLMDNKLKLAQKSIAYAELAAMQTHLVSTALSTAEETCISVLNIRNFDVFKDLINNELSVPQSLILERAYSYEINWSEAILNQYIILGRSNYIQDYCNRLELSDSTIENIVKSFQFQTNITPAMEESMSNVVELVHSVSLRYKLASLLGFRKILTALINDQSLYYLKDTNYGRNEIDFS